MKSRKRSLSDKAPQRKTAKLKSEVGKVRRRIYLVGIAFVVVYVALLARAYYLQVYDAAKLEKMAIRQHKKKIVLTPQRGTIRDRNGELVAVSLEADSVYVNPLELQSLLAKVQVAGSAARGQTGVSITAAKQTPHHDLASIASDLAKVLDLRYKSVVKKLQKKKKFIWLKRRIDARKSTQLKKMALPGIHYIREHERWYPNGKVLSQVIGFSGTDDDGLEGLERRYNSVLSGDKSYLIMQRDGGRRGIGSGQLVIKGQLGKDVTLTVDSRIQYIVEKELAKAVKDTKSKSGSVVIMDPFSGQILAMSSFPDYDPNHFNKYPAAARRNRVVCDAFEPGSTFKMFLLAAAMDANVVNAKQKIDCGKGSYRVGGKVIHDHASLGVLSVSDVLKYSSNIGCTKIAQKLGAEKFYTYLRNFGFGEKTKIDFDGERTGLLRPAQRWFEIDLAAISFGQGVTVTALQLATAASAIVNGGELYQPYLVQRVTDPVTGAEDTQDPIMVRRVIGRDIAAELRRMLVRVTEPDGTGSRASIAGFDVGGKTGTAQKVDPVTGTYSVDKRVSSFIGFAPAVTPKMVILVVLDEPKVKKTYGGLLAAPVFSRIAAQSLRYLRVPATHKSTPSSPTGIAQSRKVEQLVEIAAMNGSDVASYSSAVSASGTALMPDCRGLTARQIMHLMETDGINIMIKGRGRVVTQAPAAGKKVSAKSAVWVQLQPPR